jgi:hypothetical protein
MMEELKKKVKEAARELARDVVSMNEAAVKRSSSRRPTPHSGSGEWKKEDVLFPKPSREKCGSSEDPEDGLRPGHIANGKVLFEEVRKIESRIEAKRSKFKSFEWVTLLMNSRTLFNQTVQRFEESGLTDPKSAWRRGSDQVSPLRRDAPKGSLLCAVHGPRDLM